METRKELHKRLEEMLKKAEEDMIKCKIELENEKKKRIEDEEYLKKVEEKSKQFSIQHFGCDINTVESSLIKSAYQIINQS